MRKIKTAFRFADLGVGEAFYTKSEPHDRLIVADNFCGGWFGPYGRVPLNPNCEVIPANPKRAESSKKEDLKKVAARHGLTAKELQEEYRTACASKPYTDPTGRKSTEIVNSIPEAARAALDELMLIHRWTNGDGEHCAIVSGDYPRRLYI